MTTRTDTHGKQWELTDTEAEWVREDEELCIVEAGSRKWALCNANLKRLAIFSSMKAAMNESNMY